MTVYAYIRVSTQMQTRESQEFEIRNWCGARGMQIDKWVTESVSGTVDWEKRSLGRAVRRMKSGDEIICSELSRLGRNLLMIMSILNFCSRRGIRIHSIKDNFELSDSINSKIIAFAFGLAAEIERNLISQRTREALAAKKSAGQRLGRPCGMTPKVSRVMAELDEVRSQLGSGIPKSVIAKRYGVHRNTLNRCLRAK
jgi:DNA invertase Pin-like site-specific DNA recombinase